MMIIRSGFVWLDVTNKSKEVYSSGLFDVFKLHDDGSESMVMSFADLSEAQEKGIKLGIEVGKLDNTK